MAENSLLRLPELLSRTGLKRSTLLALMQQGTFPLPIKLGARLNAWPSGEVDQWIEAQIATRRRKTFGSVAPESLQQPVARGRK